MYWICTTRIFVQDGREVAATLVDPTTRYLNQQYGTTNLTKIAQNDLSTKDTLTFTFVVDPNLQFPDNFFSTSGFSLYSDRLVRLLRSFGARQHVFDARLVDAQENWIKEPTYYVCELDEDVLDAMDSEASDWNGDWDRGIPRLILDETKFDNRPLFVCNHVFVTLMRDDLKKAIQESGITGFAFLDPVRYRSGEYGFPPDFDD